MARAKQKKTFYLFDLHIGPNPIDKFEGVAEAVLCAQTNIVVLYAGEALHSEIVAIVNLGEGLRLSQNSAGIN